MVSVVSVAGGVCSPDLRSPPGDQKSASTADIATKGFKSCGDRVAPPTFVAFECATPHRSLNTEYPLRQVRSSSINS